MTEAESVPSSITAPVLVLGATSLVGRFLIQHLSDVQIATIAISRKTQPHKLQVEWLTADIRSTQLQIDSRPAFAFSSVPIFLLPFALPSLHQAGVRRLIAFSSTSRFTKENSPLRSEREMAKRLGDAEQTIRQFCEEHDIGWTILRPTLIYAEGRDHNISRMARFVDRYGIIPLAGAGTGKRQPVHAEDLAIGAIRAAVSPSAKNRAYNLPGGETLTYREMSERIFEGLGRRPRIVSVPPKVWLIASKMLAPLLPGISPAVGLRMSQDLTFDAESAKRDFSWHSRDFRPAFKHGIARGIAD